MQRQIGSSSPQAMCMTLKSYSSEALLPTTTSCGQNPKTTNIPYGNGTPQLRPLSVAGNPHRITLASISIEQCPTKCTRTTMKVSKCAKQHHT